MQLTSFRTQKDPPKLTPLSISAKKRFVVVAKQLVERILVKVVMSTKLLELVQAERQVKFVAKFVLFITRQLQHFRNASVVAVCDTQLVGLILVQ